MSTLWTQLTWSHIRTLFGLDYSSMNYYIECSVKDNMSVRELQEIIKNKEYDRLPEETKNKLINKDKIDVKDLVIILQ